MLGRFNPRQGWDVIGWELAVVVIGVLIALGAQQVADDLHWRAQVDEFRNALRAEASLALGTYEFRNKQNACVEHRLDELQRWLDSWRAGRPLKIQGPIGVPTSLTVETSVWESRDAATVAHMALQEKLDYGHLYNEFANNDVHRLDERAAWLELGNYDGATELDHQDLMRLQGLITRARFRDYRMATNSQRFLKRAAQIGLKPRADPAWPAPLPEICRPILKGHPS